MAHSLSKVALLAAAAAAALLPQLASAAPPSSQYKLLFSDEFNAHGVDLRKWVYRTGARTGVGINATNSSEAVHETGGLLTIKASTAAKDGHKIYLGGGLISKGVFGYGYYEVRSRPAMAGRGVHSAFWTRGVSEGAYRNTLLEVDSYEIDSGDNMATDNLYLLPNHLGQSEAPWPHRANIPVAMDDKGWFYDAFDYAPTGITYYDNGKVVAFAQFPDDFPDFPTQQNIMLTALNGVGEVEEAKQPQTTSFDYIRYYGRNYPGYNLLPNGSFDYDVSPSHGVWPLAWKVAGDAAGVSLKDDGAEDGSLYLSLAPKAGANLAISQDLQHLMNGVYTLEFWARGSALRLAYQTRTMNIPASNYWQHIVIPGVRVVGNKFKFSLSYQDDSLDRVDIDNVRFYNGMPSDKVVVEPVLDHDQPVWRLFKGIAQRFDGDRRFYFFSRILGLGPEVTVKATFNADKLENAAPIQRMPKSGSDGWAVGLRDDGSAYCAIGSLEKHIEVSADHAYAPGKPVTVTCRYVRGSASIQIDDQTPHHELTPDYGTEDRSAAGLIGATGEHYDAAGEVTGKAPGKRRLGDVNFSGTISNVAIWNRNVS